MKPLVLHCEANVTRQMQEKFKIKTSLMRGLFVLLALSVGYSLGYQRGAQFQRPVRPGVRFIATDLLCNPINSPPLEWSLASEKR